METKKKLDFKELNGQEPFIGAFSGEKRHFGLPNKEFKVFLEGENNGEVGIVGVQLITPKARKITKFVLKATAALNLEDGQLNTMDSEIIDETIDLMQELFQIPNEYIDKLTFGSLFELIGFAVTISISPSFTDKQKGSN